MKLRTAALATVVAALAATPAHATPSDADPSLTVCNQATPHSLGGDLETLPGDPKPPARYTKGLHAHPGKGAGLVHAAGRSHALQVCGEATPTDPTDEGPDFPPGDGGIIIT